MTVNGWLLLSQFINVLICNKVKAVSSIDGTNFLILVIPLRCIYTDTT